jgi:surfactin synthase thioesterase subunit
MPTWFLTGSTGASGRADAALVLIPAGTSGPESMAAWPPAAGEHGIDVFVAHLPGRGRRLFDDPDIDIADCAAELWRELSEVLPERWCVLGHCSGAMTALELAWLAERDARPPATLFVSSSRPPAELADPESPLRREADRIAALSDTEAIEHLVEHQHLPAGAEVEPDILAAVLASFRAAVAVGARYRWAHDQLGIPIQAWIGAEDDVVSAADAAGWHDYTAGDFRMIEFPGRREFLTSADAGAVRRVTQVLRPEMKALAL